MQSATFSRRCSCKQMPRAHKARHETESFRFAEPGCKLHLQPRQCRRPDLAHPAFVYAEPDANLLHGPFLEIIKAENMRGGWGVCGWPGRESGAFPPGLPVAPGQPRSPAVCPD